MLLGNFDECLPLIVGEARQLIRSVDGFGDVFGNIKVVVYAWIQNAVEITIGS